MRTSSDNTRMVDLENKLTFLTDQYMKLENEIAENLNKTEFLKLEVLRLETLVANTSNSQPSCSKNCATVLPSTTPPPPPPPPKKFQPEAFFASTEANVDAIKNVTLDYIVKFREVSYNLNQNYNRNTGVYTCGRAGIYVFHVTLESMGQPFTASLRRGTSHHLLGIFTGNDHDGGYQTGSGTVITSCQTGDQISVRISWIGGLSVNIRGETQSHFSGFLYHEF
jgi:hypothetical protein